MGASVHEQFEEYCEETEQTKTFAVEHILDRFFSSYYSEPVEKRTMWTS